MFHHRPAARGPGGQLTRLRNDVTDWIAQAVRRGQLLHVVRTDLPAGLITDLAVAILSTVDRWNLDRGDAEQVRPQHAITLLSDVVGTGTEAARPTS